VIGLFGACGDYLDSFGVLNTLKIDLVFKAGYVANRQMVAQVHKRGL
jgi:hypothetical protein